MKPLALFAGFALAASAQTQTTPITDNKPQLWFGDQYTCESARNDTVVCHAGGYTITSTWSEDAKTQLIPPVRYEAPQTATATSYPACITGRVRKIADHFWRCGADHRWKRLGGAAR